MSETPAARPLIDAAEQAASAGDYAGAERLLREAVAIQEAELGPLDPDLANTLNNLGVVCEILDKPVDADQYYQKGYEIAAAVLAPDHPFVTTSRKNLDDFHRARGRPAAPPKVELVVLSDEPLHAAPAVQPPSPPPMQTDPPAVQRRNNPRLVALAAIGLVLAIGVVMASILWGGFDRRDEPPVTQPAPSKAESAAPPPTTEGDRLPPKELASVGPKEIARAGTPAPRVPAPANAPSRSAPPIVTSAKLCRVLSTSTSSGDWQCTPPERPVDAGLLSFYTRLRSTTNTTVQHRWYRGDRLYQSRDLRIDANAVSGYRTFSRYRMGAESRGHWRVELRTAEGILLHEEQFDVR